MGAREFISHLESRHQVTRTMLLSGDRQSEVEYLADRVGLTVALSSVSPERKLEIVRQETALAPTVFLGTRRLRRTPTSSWTQVDLLTFRS